MIMITITDDGEGGYIFTPSHPNDFHGFVGFSNQTSGTLTDVQVDSSAGDGPYTASSLEVGALVYAPVSPISATTFTVTIDGSIQTPIQIIGQTGKPQIQEASAEEGITAYWQNARVQTQVAPNNLTNATIYASVAGGTFTELAGPIDVSVGDTLDLSADSGGSNPVSINLIFQGTTVTVSDNSSQLGVDTAVLTADTANGAQVVTVVNTSTLTDMIAVKLVEFGSPPPAGFTLIGQGQSAQFGVASTDAYLSIYKSNAVGQSVAKSKTAKTAQQAAGDPNIVLWDDPIVVIRHKPIGNITS